MNNPFDVVVAGGGPAGLGAALGAARLGVRTALLERHDILGGMGTAALVNNFCPAHLDGSRLIIGGIFAELRNRLIARRAIFASRNCAYALEPYNPGVFVEEAAALCREAGVQVFLNARIVAAECPTDRPARIQLADGTVITARTVVDATGDAVVAAASGVQYHQGADRDHAVMPLTFCYKIGPVDHEKLRRLRLPGTDITDDPTTGQVRFLVSGMADLVALEHRSQAPCRQPPCRTRPRAFQRDRGAGQIRAGDELTPASAPVALVKEGTADAAPQRGIRAAPRQASGV
ncbi:MAG: FAD-dependent oxidoreductase [Limisphaerales bacterium]